VGLLCLPHTTRRAPPRPLAWYPVAVPEPASPVPCAHLSNVLAGALPIPHMEPPHITAGRRSCARQSSPVPLPVRSGAPTNRWTPPDSLSRLGQELSVSPSPHVRQLPVAAYHGPGALTPPVSWEGSRSMRRLGHSVKEV